MKHFIGKTMSYLEVGRNQVIGRVMGVAQLMLTFIIYLKVDGKDFELPVLAGAMVFLFFLLTVSGWIYMKLGLLEIEIQHRNRHSPELMQTISLLKEIKQEIQKKQ